MSFLFYRGSPGSKSLHSMEWENHALPQAWSSQLKCRFISLYQSGHFQFIVFRQRTGMAQPGKSLIQVLKPLFPAQVTVHLFNGEKEPRCGALPVKTVTCGWRFPRKPAWIHGWLPTAWDGQRWWRGCPRPSVPPECRRPAWQSVPWLPAPRCGRPAVRRV